MANQVLFVNNRNNGITFNKKASTAFAPGMLVTIDGTTGYIIPATNLTPILGVCNESVTSADTNYADNSPLNVSEATYNDELMFTVSTGSATQAMVGRYVPVDAASTGVVVAGISTTVGAATPILITKFINATTILGKIAFRF